MKLLTIRTDKPEAEVGIYEDDTQQTYHVWPAHRQLAETIHSTIQDVLKNQSLELSDIEAIVCYKGPGSFTGLRIGLSVANALADSLNIPIVGIANDNAWIERGIAAVLSGTNDKLVLPEYGAPVHITQPKK
jgi:tRNA threonylcarbamoyladenosine biosynthesis protein TsaB